MSRSCIVSLLVTAVAICSAQSPPPYATGQYAGILQAAVNPALLATQPLKLDFLVMGLDVTFNNSWVGVKRSALSFPRLPGSWRNYTPNIEGNLYSNFDWKHPQGSREVLLDQRVFLPSALVRLGSRSIIGLSGSIRQMGNLSGLQAPLAALFEQQFALGAMQNTPVQNSGFLALRMSWLEYGVSYARTVLVRNGHRVAVGGTVKLLIGLEAAYFNLRDLNFLFSNKDTLSHLDADFSVAHSATSGSMLNVSGNLSDRLGHAASARPGADAGISWEWRPQSEQTTSRYRLKAGVSVTDIGKIKFTKQPDYYDMHLSIRQSDIIRYISAENVHMIDSLLQHDFPVNTGSRDFTVMLPSAVCFQADWRFPGNFYLNFSGRYTAINTSQALRVRNYPALCIAPRYESYWGTAAFSLSYNSLSAKRNQAIVPGALVRFGPLTVGSSDLTFLFANNLTAFNIYAMAHMGIPYRKTGKTARQQ